MTQPSGSFRVDMEQAPDALHELQSALDQLESIKQDAMRLGAVNPGSKDSVSADAARLIGAAAVGGPGALVPALDAGMQQIRALVASMQSDLDSYRDNDVRAAGRLRGIEPS